MSNIQMQVKNESGYEAIYPVPAKHASSHASGGSDAITPASIGAVPTSRTVNGKALSADINLSASDVGAYSKSETDTLLKNKAAVSHTHDDRYYTESEVNNLLAGKQDTSSAINTSNIGSQPVKNADTVDGWDVNLNPGSFGIKPICAGTGDYSAGSTSMTNGSIYLVYE